MDRATIHAVDCSCRSQRLAWPVVLASQASKTTLMYLYSHLCPPSTKPNWHLGQFKLGDLTLKIGLLGQRTSLGSLVCPKRHGGLRLPCSIIPLLRPIGAGQQFEGEGPIVQKRAKNANSPRWSLNKNKRAETPRRGEEDSRRAWITTASALKLYLFSAAVIRSRTVV